MKYLVHYYYGDRLETFQVGIGLLIRALGHSKIVKVYLIDNNFEWVKKLSRENYMPTQIYSLNVDNEFLSEIYKELETLSDTICLLANFDLILTSKRELNEFIQKIIALSVKNEVIITFEKKKNELENIADYVSSISIKEF